MTADPQYPVMYSLRHCPWAMRARMAVLLAKQPVMLRDIVLKHKPAELLAASPKGSVPVLVISDQEVINDQELLNGEQVIEQSLDIMLWALGKTDPHNLLYSDDPKALPAMLALIHTSDTDFRNKLKKYKCAARYHDPDEIEYRQQCEAFIGELEQRLTAHQCLMGDKPSLADYALLPNIRQFARVDRKWYVQAPYPKLQNWLNGHLQSALFSKVMTQYPQWLDSGEAFLIGE